MRKDVTAKSYGGDAPVRQSRDPAGGVHFGVEDGRLNRRMRQGGDYGTSTRQGHFLDFCRKS